MEDGTCSPTTAGTPQGGRVSPRLALLALHGRAAAITPAYPEARVMAYADDGVVLHADRLVLEPCQHLFMTWLAEIGRTLNGANTRICHTLEGDQPGMDFRGFVRHEVAYTAVMTQQGGPNLVCCHQYPTQTCGWSHPAV
jgi:RNA-directed DNA polymerase